MTYDHDPQIDSYLASLPQWQRDNLQSFRDLVHSVEPTLTEAFKWNVPVYLVGKKMAFASAGFKAHTKYNFIANGALIEDPKGLFNNGFDSKTARGIDLSEGQTPDTDALADLVRSSLELLRP